MSRVRADATAVLMPRNSSRLFTLINKGKPGKRTGISGESPAFVFARPSTAKEWVSGTRLRLDSAFYDARRYSGEFRNENGSLMFRITTAKAGNRE